MIFAIILPLLSFAQVYDYNDHGTNWINDPEFSGCFTDVYHQSPVDLGSNFTETTVNHI